MKRNNLLNKLIEYNSPYSEEESYKNIIISFVQNHEDCFERSLQEGHITASAWLLNKNKTHALLMHHSKLNIWVQLGGHCDGDSDVLRVAIKEAQEESGIQSITFVQKNIFDIDVHLIPATSKEQAHYHYDIRFLLHVTSDEEFIQNHESKELRWIGKNQKLPVGTTDSVQRMFSKWIALP